MKQLKYALLMLALFAPAALIAQAAGDPGGGQMEAGPHAASVDDQLDDLSQKLNLTDAQKPQVKTILQDQRDQMKQAMTNSSASREETRSKMRGIHKASSAKIRALLNDEQRAKFDAMQGQHRHMGEKHGEGAPPPAPQQ
jgi:Spy/CpxP family protein refolding chaperone